MLFWRGIAHFHQLFDPSIYFNWNLRSEAMGTQFQWRFLLFLVPAALIFAYLAVIENTEISPFLFSRNTTNEKPLRIGIIIVIEGKTNLTNYKRAIDSLKCYSNVHGYEFIIAYDRFFSEKCPNKDKFFRRHCVVFDFLPKYDYLLFVDADIGVVNPKRRIEDFIDDRFDITFYNRFYNQEIASGSYLIRNTSYSLDFIKGYADYEHKLPKSFHGTDNGALHIYVVNKIYPERRDEYSICEEIYNISQNYEHLFAYENCIRTVLGIGEEFGKIRILQKGNGWVRDIWLTNSRWNPERDFMLHDLKLSSNRKYSKNDLPIKAPDHVPARSWYDPIIGDFDFDKCKPGNTSWNLDKNLIAPVAEIEGALAKQKRIIQREGFKLLAKIPSLLKFA